MQRPTLIAPLLLALGLSACLENEEQLVIHEDGSVEVRLAARGDLADLSNGYPVPLGVGWELVSDDAQTWASQVGTDTGSPAVQARIREVAWPDPRAAEEDEVRLEVSRRFASVAELPQWFAPEAEPYRTAYMRRTTELDVREGSGRKVYVFERVYHGRNRAQRDALHQSWETVPEEIRNRFENQEVITPEDWRIVTEVVQSSFEDAAEVFAREAIRGLYTQGDASLSPTAVAPIVAEVRRNAGTGITMEKLVAIWESANIETEAEPVAEEAEEGEGARLVRELEEGMRQSIRDTLSTALREAGVSLTTCNAILYGLEWEFTAFAHTDDIRDEEFKVWVKLPGTLISGNYDEADDGEAFWSFEGEDLDDRDIVLRAVSVLE